MAKEEKEREREGERALGELLCLSQARNDGVFLKLCGRRPDADGGKSVRVGVLGEELVEGAEDKSDDIEDEEAKSRAED